MLVKFKYYDEFHCVGPKCKDSCCKNWHILITKREYLDYKKIKCSPELKEIIDKAFKRYKKDTEYNYAEMQLKENGNCPFLGDDSLCMLQKELGEDILSMTCRIFPRIRSCVGTNAIMECCTATCSHVVELLIQHPEGLQIVEEEYDKKDKYLNRNLFAGSVISKKHKEYPYFWNIINAEVDILQNRGFTVPERLLVLGYFCKKADEYIQNDNGDKIAGLAEMLLDNELCRKIADSLKPPYSEDRIAKESLNTLININESAKKLYFINKLFKRVFDYLKYEFTIDADKIKHTFDVPGYLKVCETFRALENERSYIIENLLVNLLFMYDPKRGVWGNYFDMAVFYNVLKICAPVFLPENYNDQDLALALTYAVKMVVNSNLAHIAAVNNFMLKGQYTLPYAAFLIC